MSSESSKRLTIVVPCFNAADTLPSLVEAIAESECASEWQVILVDDGSTDATADMARSAERTHDFVQSIILPENAGAGIARNVGFAQATGIFTLFFDADDTVHLNALAAAVNELERENADIAILPYVFERGDGSGDTAMNHYDAKVWEALVGAQDKVVGHLDSMAQLLGMSNYPWNKVLRTSTYRDAGLRFGSSLVHNDILGHWHSYLHADRIILLNSVICTHHIRSTGQHLTNRASRDRLYLFDSLDETYTLLEAYPAFRARYAHHYWSFVIRVVEWARPRMDQRDLHEFAARLQEHISRIDLADYFSTSLKWNPMLARRLSQILMN
ncbi:MAG: glycosyltransferase family 2 protein [Rhodobacteraceae bacterium]|nr:glycosyltransferase family 2 protein [Paracoccaceae bacterium]